MDDRVEIVEVGPRDGLQNEARPIDVAQKLALIEACADAGLRHIEVGAFVSPKWVPQMANSAEVVARLPKRDVLWSVLVPNMRGMAGLDAIEDHLVGEIAVFVSASEGFSRSNLNCSIDESIERLLPVIDQVKNRKLNVRGYVSCITDCPFDGPVAPSQVAQVSDKLMGAGCDSLSLGDTIGKGTPERVDAAVAAVLDVAEPSRVAGHFHDTNGRAIENVAVCLERGLRIFDSAVGGLGGCPYAPGAAGNLATETLVGYLHGAGFDTGVDETALMKAAKLAKGLRDGHH
ncbi:hydroxymethylglutaryl-CoA lyase [Nereida sp. MMG025]|uniref:hydroxymethylglutaryl-CoA lyase n=1 Tax=Nereida sp. MMG025 TaxID=2909981 RepID=UPI001F00F933|nr:hydroxymethylglutaryl-CoA lyase [Nereida sp. MMG025]MCF6445287.1 hydroxymethylglutaryl-CoA lyase [Nereida sp. MMG025]